MPNDIHVRPAETARDRRAIVTFPRRIYRNDPLWVPPLISERLARLDPQRNPFFQTGEAQPFLAYRQGKLAGTIAPAINHRSNRYLGEKVAVFGFFEVIEDDAVTRERPVLRSGTEGSGMGDLVAIMTRAARQRWPLGAGGAAFVVTWIGLWLGWAGLNETRQGVLFAVRDTLAGISQFSLPVKDVDVVHVHGNVQILADPGL